MLIVCFGDGLGNQMFQYAFYRALKKEYVNNDVYMDIFRIYGGYIHNGFELDKIFNIEINEVQLEKALRLADFWPQSKLLYRLMNKIHGVRRYVFGPKSSHIKQDDPTAFYPEVFNLSLLKSYIFCGNWVNEQYFLNCQEEIILDFTFPPIIDERNLKYASAMTESNSVSVHIRKGDYINSAMLNLRTDYYLMAKRILKEKVSNPHYFIFADDKNAISEYLKLFDEYTIVEGNCGEQSFRDMQLMSLCKHNIIANSTFSFWGAYLNRNENKVVIAPNKAKYDFRNPFACGDWIVIPYNGSPNNIN